LEAVPAPTKNSEAKPTNLIHLIVSAQI